MKNIKSILFALIAILTLTACPNPEPDPVEEEYLAVGEQRITFSSSSGSEFVEVLANTDWTASCIDASWCGVLNLGWSARGFYIEVTENTSTESREATIVVQGGNITKYVYVTQDGSKPQPQANGIEDVHNTQTDQPAYAPKH